MKRNKKWPADNTKRQAIFILMPPILFQMYNNQLGNPHSRLFVKPHLETIHDSLHNNFARRLHCMAMQLLPYLVLLTRVRSEIPLIRKVFLTYYAPYFN
ncbi:MAG: hypothetical protein QME52_13305 [Bacteroidota bacterium]|nr:hypothetical protein [Bacteroidota bacterium]